MAKPEMYIQSLEDEASEVASELDKAFPSTLKGKNTDGYRVGVLENGNYETSRVDNLEEAENEIENILENSSPDYNTPDQIEELLIEKRTWIQ